MKADTATPTDSAELYLELLKKCLTREGFPDRYRELTPEGWRSRIASIPQPLLRRLGLELVRRDQYTPEQRSLGLDWPGDAETMIGTLRLNNLHYCVSQVLADGVPGDLIETGVWRGGSVIFMRGALKAHSVTDRVVWVADSFQGLPEPDPARYPADRGDELFRISRLAVSMEDVKSNFARYGLLDDQVRFLRGWFKDTLPTAPIDKLAVMRLDGDLYESTMDALEALYPKLAPGGFAIIDDYGAMPPCRAAVLDYREANGISEPIVTIDHTGVYWRRLA